MDDALSCDVCMELFDDDVHLPRALNCLHTFCEGCLVDLAKEQDNQKVICPNCRMDVPLKDGDVKNILCNYTVQDLAAAAQIATKSTEPTCEVCEEEPATHRCVECAEFLCEGCYRPHRKMKATRDHTIQTLVEFKEKGVDRKIRPVYCAVHTAKKEKHELVYCCIDCNFKPICMACALMEHKEHNYVEMEGAVTEQKVEIEQMIPKLGACAADFVSALGKIASIRQAIILGKSKADSEIKRSFNALHDKVGGGRGR